MQAHQASTTGRPPDALRSAGGHQVRHSASPFTYHGTASGDGAAIEIAPGWHAAAKSAHSGLQSERAPPSATARHSPT